MFSVQGGQSLVGQAGYRRLGLCLGISREEAQQVLLEGCAGDCQSSRAEHESRGLK